MGIATYLLYSTKSLDAMSWRLECYVLRPWGKDLGMSHQMERPMGVPLRQCYLAGFRCGTMSVEGRMATCVRN